VKGNVVDPVESSGVGPADRPAELPAAQVRRAAAGDRDAARALIERYQDLVYGYLGRMLGARGQSAAVDDVAQDTFVRALGALARFDPEGPARLSTWLLTIATRRAIDVLRAARDHVPLDAVPLIAEERPDRRVITRSVYRAVAALPHEQRAAFLLRELYGFTVAETAAALEVEPGTVKSRVARARARLARALEGPGD
jgi:RNA polymerase sigma-70 factor (ECF subfamily)